MTDEGRIHENSIGGLLTMCEMGMNQGILPYLGWKFLACSPERLPFSSVLGVKYAVVMAENAVKQCPSPSTVKMDHKSPAAKSLSYPLDSSCVCVFVLFWGYSQNR